MDTVRNRGIIMILTPPASRLFSWIAMLGIMVCPTLRLASAAPPSTAPASTIKAACIDQETALLKVTQSDLADYNARVSVEKASTNPTDLQVRAIRAASAKVADDVVALGDLPTAAAIDFLVQNITFTDPNIPVDRPLVSTPFAAALVEIGSPAFPALIANLAVPQPTDWLRFRTFRLTAIVLYKAIGKSAAIAYVRDQELAATDPTGRQRFDVLVENIDVMP